MTHNFKDRAAWLSIIVQKERWKNRRHFHQFKSPFFAKDKIPKVNIMEQNYSMCGQAVCGHNAWSCAAMRPNHRNALDDKRMQEIIAAVRTIHTTGSQSMKTKETHIG